MNDIRRTGDPAADRVAEAVRHALRLVGPTERGPEGGREDPRSERSAA